MGASRSHLGAVLENRRGILGHLGCVLGVLEGTWMHLGVIIEACTLMMQNLQKTLKKQRFFNVSHVWRGSKMRPGWLTWGILGETLGYLKLSWAFFGPSWAYLGPSWGDLQLRKYRHNLQTPTVQRKRIHMNPNCSEKHTFMNLS